MKRILLIVAFLLPIYGHASTINLETESDRLRAAAMQASEQNNVRAAIKLIRRAIKVSRHLPETSWRTIENYDDAGLYYYQVGKWQAATHHQAIAVLLSCGVPESASLFPAYVQRLGWAFSKYRPGEDFALIVADPLILLKDTRLDVRKNSDLRRRFFKTYAVGGPHSGSVPKYIYKLRPETTPESCYPKRLSAPRNAVN